MVAGDGCNSLTSETVAQIPVLQSELIAAAAETMARMQGIPAGNSMSQVSPEIAPGSSVGNTPITGNGVSMPPVLSPTVVKEMEKVVRTSGDRRWAVRKILRMGVLAGQRVEYRKFGQPVLSGTMTRDGRVLCDCSACKGQQIVTCLAFEEHAGGYLRRPADSMYILSLGKSIRDFCLEGRGGEGGAGAGGSPPSGSDRPGRKRSGGSAGSSPHSTPPKRGRSGAHADAEELRPAEGGAPARKPKERNSTKHKRLFSGGEGCPLRDGEEVRYIASKGGVLLRGAVRIGDGGPSGILCSCCNNVVSCSTFEAHAGRGARRAPYDNIFNAGGESLRELAKRLPDEAGPPPRADTAVPPAEGSGPPGNPSASTQPEMPTGLGASQQQQQQQQQLEAVQSMLTQINGHHALLPSMPPESVPMLSMHDAGPIHLIDAGLPSAMSEVNDD